MRRVPPLLTLLGALACSPGPATEPADSSSLPAETPEEPALPAARVVAAAPALPFEFPHGEHGSLLCRRCHASPAGHERHAEIPCAECHTVEVAAAEPDPAGCASCHHRQARAECARCHREPPAGTLLVSIHRSGGSAEPRTLPFAHDRHDGLACERCHASPGVEVARDSCAGCHEKHHQPAATCTTCHPSAPRQAHEGQVHLGCGGAGCHTDAAVVSLPATRPLCLVCHAERAEHEPGRPCEGCHLTRVGGGGGGVGT